MPVSLVVVAPGLLSFDAIAHSIQRQTGVGSIPWTMIATLYRPTPLLISAPPSTTIVSTQHRRQQKGGCGQEKSSTEATVQSLYLLSYSDGRPDGVVIEPAISHTVKGIHLGSLLSKLKNLWTVRQSLRCTGVSFQLNECILNMGNITVGTMTVKGILVEIIYHAASTPTSYTSDNDHARMDMLRPLFDDLLALYVSPLAPQEAKEEENSKISVNRGSNEMTLSDPSVHDGTLGDYVDAYVTALRQRNIL